MHAFICLSIKMFSIVLYFAPALGLFHMAAMWEKESIDFSNAKFILDFDETKGRTQSVSRVWSSHQSSDYTRYTIFSLSVYYVFFLVFVPAQCAVLYFAKEKFVPSFRGERLSSSKKILHVVTCLIFPSIYEDWDIKKTEDVRY